MVRFDFNFFINCIFEIIFKEALIKSEFILFKKASFGAM